MTLITTVNSTGLIDQLADEYIPTYTANNLTITQIVTALLDFQVLTPAITVGTIDPTVSRSIKVDGDTILRALYRLRDTVGGHIYVDNNRALQWKTTIGEDKGQQIRYRKNLKGITREIDYTTLANRLYAYGAGEGDARIKLSDVEGQEEDYIESEESQTEWGGIYPKVIVDKSITHPDTLLAWAQLRLTDLKNPRITYQVDTVDLSESLEVGFSFEALLIGSTLTIIDEDLGIDVSAQVVKITHPDLLHPELMEIEVANRTKDISDSLAEVYDTQQLSQHVATIIGAGQVIVKGAFTVKDWVTEGETTIVGSHIETGTIVLGKLDFIPLTSSGATGAIVATINASAEGITIDADKINITVGKAIFYQDAIPTSLHVGDLWFDTDDKNKVYRAASIGANEITAGEWELARDEDIAASSAAIIVNQDNITLNVTNISNLDGRVVTAEGEIIVNANAITLEVTNRTNADTTLQGSITVNADNILLRVSKNDVINQINISTEGIQINAGRLSITGKSLDDLVDGTYGKVLTIDISEGHVKLSSTIQTAEFKTVTGVQKENWDAKPEDMDEIGQGTSYWKIATTEIEAGHIKIWTAVDGEGYRKYSDTEYTKLAGVAPYADVTDGHSLAVLTSRTLAFIADTTTRKAVSATEKTGAYEAYNIFISKLTAYGLSIWTANSSTRVELTSTGLKGYNAGVLQAEVRATDGKIYAGAGAVILDVNGITLTQANYFRFVYNSVTKGYLTLGATSIAMKSTSGNTVIIGAAGAGYLQLEIDGTSVLAFYPDALGRDLVFAPVGSATPFRPTTANMGYLGNASYYWKRAYVGTYYGKVDTIQTFQNHDDIALVKAIKAKRVGDQNVLDFDSLPREIKMVEKDKKGKDIQFVAIANLSSLALGAIKQLADRLEILEAKVGG